LEPDGTGGARLATGDRVMDVVGRGRGRGSGSRHPIFAGATNINKSPPGYA